MSERKPVDESLASERTDLAWNRSGLAFVACVAVLLRRIWPLRGDDQVIALACISIGAVVWALALSAGRALSARSGGAGGVLSLRRACVIVAGTLALAIGGFVLAFFPPS
jgi:hypothetical protein